ncbi:unnamed protein product [Phytophthora fragariaefolia]|uniref:Unnamed protein product n=1 Tax=Phytophthora fragariaefolia TaxID=1490495 RepID=A0A9W6XBJ6_9STRA|nr:unnamed protein product [Phytophthora fragariaefolia]
MTRFSRTSSAIASTSSASKRPRSAPLTKENIGDYTLLTLPAAEERHGVAFAIPPGSALTFTGTQRQPGDAYMGIHGRGIWNRNGHALAGFCFSHHLFATSTGFRKPARYRTTWTQRRTDHCIYNQIDYILCPQNCRRLCMDARSWGGTLTASDHKLVTADFILDESTHRKRFSHNVHRHEPTRPRLSRDRHVHDELVRAQYAEALKDVLSTQDATPGLASNTKQRRRYQDEELQQLQEAQRDLQLRLYNDCAENTKELRKARNKILHRIKDRYRDIARRILDEKVAHIENMSDSARMYAAVRDINTSGPQPLLLLDKDGKYILHQRTANQLVKTHFQQQFYVPERPTVAPDREPKPLFSLITPDEVGAAFRRLNNGRASGTDDIPAEILKYGAPVLAPRFAELINTSFEQGLPLALGEDTLLCLPKPNKPRGQCSSLRPIVLLNTVRKAISPIVLARISPAVDTYLSSHQSGFRKHRNTVDAVWAHKRLCARVQCYREVIHVLGIDLARAFDTIDREKLLDVLRTFLEDDDIRLIKLLLVDTTLSLRTRSTTLPPFCSNIGTPQGDSLSPVLFVVYLDAAFRDLADHIAVPRNLLEQMIVYADNADFICRDPELAQRIQTEAPEKKHGGLPENLAVSLAIPKIYPGANSSLLQRSDDSGISGSDHSSQATAPGFDYTTATFSRSCSPIAAPGRTRLHSWLAWKASTAASSAAS